MPCITIMRAAFHTASDGEQGHSRDGDGAITGRGQNVGARDSHVIANDGQRKARIPSGPAIKVQA
jgi:hypothetical protein